MGLISVLFLGGFIAKHFWSIVAIAGVVVAIKRLPGILDQLRREAAARAAAEQARIDGLVARADEQHAWAMVGDPRGTFGPYPPAV